MTQPLSTFDQNLTLPSGGTVRFMDPDDLTGNDMKKALSFVTPDQAGATTVSIGTAFTAAEQMVCLLVEEWSIPYRPGKPKEASDDPWPLPTTDATLVGQLSRRDYLALLNAIEPAMRVLAPGPVTPDDAGVPGSPTGPASD